MIKKTVIAVTLLITMLLTACGSSGEERKTVSEDKGQAFTVEDKNVNEENTTTEEVTEVKELKKHYYWLEKADFSKYENKDSIRIYPYASEEYIDFPTVINEDFFNKNFDAAVLSYREYERFAMDSKNLIYNAGEIVKKGKNTKGIVELEKESGKLYLDGMNLYIYNVLENDTAISELMKNDYFSLGLSTYTSDEYAFKTLLGSNYAVPGSLHDNGFYGAVSNRDALLDDILKILGNPDKLIVDTRDKIDQAINTLEDIKAKTDYFKSSEIAYTFVYKFDDYEIHIGIIEMSSDDEYLDSGECGARVSILIPMLYTNELIQAKQEWCNIDVREDYIITVQ